MLRILKRIYHLAPPNNVNCLIVHNRWGRRLSTQYLNKQLKWFRDYYRLNIKNFSTHTFRKTFGRRIWENANYSEKSLLLLSDIFQHSSIRTTKIYLGITDEEIGQAYDLL